MYTRVRASLGLAVVAATLGACAGDVTEAPAPIRPSLDEVPTQGRVRLVKFGPSGTFATFSISATGGTFPMGQTVTIPACDETIVCPTYNVWLSSDASTVTVSITETSSTGNVVLERINILSSVAAPVNILNPVDPTGTITVSNTITGAIRFKNVPGDVPPPPPPPPADLNGCTPGFWKQPHHFEYWTAPYTPTTQFGSVFANAFPGMTLVQVAAQGGGGIKALGRHTVAALLNAAHPGVDYGMTTADVISGFNAAVASGNYEAQKAIFSAKNERDCTAKD